MISFLHHLCLVFVLIMISCYSKPECGDVKSEELPADLPEFPTLENAVARASDGCQIIFLLEDKIVIGKDEISVDGLCQAMLNRNCFERSVIMRAKRKTGYKFYITVYKAVQNCYLQKMDELAFAQFSKKYIELNEQEKKQVDPIMPFDIIEVKPE